MANDNESVALPETEEGQLALLKRLLDPARGGKLDEAAVRTALTQQFGDRAREAATVDPAPKKSIDLPTPIELTPEVLAETLAGMERDYRRGIVVVDETKGVDHFRAALKKNRTAGKSWEEIKAKLEANDNRLLKEATGMQGKGTFVGVYPDGTLCMKDRGNEPVIFGTLQDQQVKVTTDTPNRNELLQQMAKEGQFANYWEIRNAVYRDKLALPPDAPDYEKRGVVAAAEAVTGEDFVRSANGKEWRSAILECGNVSRSSNVSRREFLSVPWARLRLRWRSGVSWWSSRGGARAKGLNFSL